MTPRPGAPRIARVETFLVPPRWLFCRVETDDGLVGWGEPVVEGRAEVVRTAVDVLAAEYLLGNDPAQIERHWVAMTRGGFYRGGPEVSSAVAGLDQALWDLLGKRLGVPVHALLGGAVRDRIRVYAWVGGDEPAQVADEAAKAVATGVTAVKLNATGALPALATAADLAAAGRRAEAVRAAIGDDRDLAIDVHGRAAPADARRLLDVLAPSRPLFVEEPVLPEHAHALPALVAGTTVPIATGERLYARGEFLPALQAGVAVVQPDPCHAGGISETRRIATLAETFGALLAPHCPLGPIALASCLQLAAVCHNFLIQEQSLGIHYHSGVELLDYVLDTGPFAVDGGHVAVPSGAGLGVDVDERAVRAADRTGHAWRNPRFTRPDGAFTEW